MDSGSAQKGSGTLLVTGRRKREGTDATYAERTLDFLWSIAPDGATNSQIARRLGIRSHQTVYLLTQDLRQKGLIRGEQREREWVFYAIDELPFRSPPSGTRASQTMAASGALSPRAFETLGRRLLSDHFGTVLLPGSVPGVRKQFNFVSPDRRIIGDAKYYSRVGGVALPPAKFATIAEHVWLLEKTGAARTFLVFGHDRQVPLWWLERFGNLLSGVAFYFLTDNGQLEVLVGPCHKVGDG